MEEKKLQLGDEAKSKIAGKDVVMKPLTLGRMKKAMMIFQSKDGDAFDMMQRAIVEILSPINDFVTNEWVADNVTMNEATKILMDMRTINGISSQKDFQDGPEKPAIRVENELLEKAPIPSV